MTSAPAVPLLKRVPPGAWVALAWCASTVYAKLTTAGPHEGWSPRFATLWNVLIVGTLLVLLGGFLLERQPLARAALRMVVESAADLELAGEAGTGQEAVRLAGETSPDVVVMDIRMPGMDGIEATRRILGGNAATRVVILTTFDEDEHVYAALRAGASGFLVKDMALPDILAAVRVVATGEALTAPSVTRRLIEAYVRRPDPAAATATPSLPRLSSLSEREREVLALVAEGLSNAEIGERLYIGTTTVKTHVTRMLAKLDARDRVHLVILAYRSGLVEL